MLFDVGIVVVVIEVIVVVFKFLLVFLKYEFVYCFGQIGNVVVVKFLCDVFLDLQEDFMCCYEVVEVLGVIGIVDNLEFFKQFWDREGEEVVVKEICEIVIDRIEWENFKVRQLEKLCLR